MLIRFIFKKIGYSIHIGESAGCSSIYWFGITKEWYGKRYTVTDAKEIFNFYKYKQFR